MNPIKPDSGKSITKTTAVFLAIYTVVGTPLLLSAIGLCDEGTASGCGPRSVVNAAAFIVIAYTVLQWVLFRLFRKKQSRTGMKILIFIPLSLLVLMIFLTNFINSPSS